MINLTSHFLPTYFSSSFFFASCSSFPYIPHLHTTTSISPPLSFLMCIFEKYPVSNCKVTHHLPPPPCSVVWAYQDPGIGGLIMQAAVSPLRWGPPGDSSTASDWGCATKPDSSSNNTEKRMLMDQIRWELRWEEGVRRRRGGRWQALLISCHSERGLVCAIACICCACLSEKHWPPRITPPVTDMFSLQSALKFERWRKGVNGGTEWLVKAIDGWMWEAIYSTLLCSFILPSNMPFPSSIYPA